MTAQTEARRSEPMVATVARIFRDQPLIPLLGLLAVLVAAFAIANPEANFSGYVASTMRTAIPLAILAGCQTLVMLTGGIDLSVGGHGVDGRVRRGLALHRAQQPVHRDSVALLLAVLIGAVNGIGVGVFRVHPLIMTLGVSLIILGAANAYQLLTVQD